jgi:hypothetical protein
VGYFFARFFFWALFLGAISMQSTESSLRLASTDEALQQKLSEFLPEHLPILSVSYQVDASYDESQLDYLIDLHPGKNLDVSSLLRALFYLQKSKKFSDIALSLRRNDQG